MTLPDISIPDIQQADIESCHAAAANMMYFAKSCTHELILMEGVPEWCAEIGEPISHARELAATCMNHTCPYIMRGIALSVTDFNLTFQLLGNFFQNTIKEISCQDGLPVRNQRQYIDGLLADLINTVAVQQKQMILLRQKVNAIAVQMDDCYKRLSAGLRAISVEHEDIQQLVDRIKPLAGNDLLQANMLSPANWLKSETALFVPVFVYVMFEQMMTEIRSAQCSIQAIVDAWATVKKKYTIIITELDDASDEEYTECLYCMNLETARHQWQKLSDNVSVLAGNDVQQLKQGLI